MDLGFSGEMIFLALLGLILFGPRKLPEIARKAGRFVDDLKRASSEFQGQLNREVANLEPLDPTKNDPTKNLFTSLVDDFKALRAETEPVKAVLALAEPAQLTQQRTQTSLLDNVRRIKDLLANGGTATATHGGEQPSQPAELAATEMERVCATSERMLAESAPQAPPGR